MRIGKCVKCRRELVHYSSILEDSSHKDRRAADTDRGPNRGGLFFTETGIKGYSVNAIFFGINQDGKQICEFCFENLPDKEMDEWG